MKITNKKQLRATGLDSKRLEAAQGGRGIMNGNYVCDICDYSSYSSFSRCPSCGAGGGGGTVHF